MDRNIDNTEFNNFVKDIKNKILSSQYEALKAVNKELISLYWGIGKSIVESQETHGWGKSVVKNLSDELRKEFVGIKGFSVQNLWNMRLFYLEYSQNEKLQTLSREIGWSHNVLIFQKSKDRFEREFYIQMTKKFGWTYRVLDNQIDNKSYEKYLLNQTNFDKTMVEKYKYQAKLALKDEYNFDFLELGDEHSEPNGIRQTLDIFLLPSQPNKIYLCFVVLEIMQKNEIIELDIKLTLKKLLDKYPTVKGYLNSIGIPERWVI